MSGRKKKLRQFLEALSTDELEALRRKHTYRISPELNKQSLIDSLWNSFTNSLEQGEFSFGDLVQTVLEEAKSDGRTKVVPYIRDALQEMTFSKNIGRKDASQVREAWFNSEAFQVLQREFRDRQYVVYQEKKYDFCRVDLSVEKEDGTAVYPIEVKRTYDSGSVKRLPAQLDDHRDIPRREYSFVLLIAEDKRSHPDHAGGGKTVGNVIRGARSRDDVRVIAKGPEDMRT